LRPYLMARLAALVPQPRMNLTRYHGVFAPNSPHRALVTKADRGRGAKRAVSEAVEEETPAARRSAMTWAQRLKRRRTGGEGHGCCEEKKASEYRW
jgi:hypothetical protein